MSEPTLIISFALISIFRKINRNSFAPNRLPNNAIAPYNQGFPEVGGGLKLYNLPFLTLSSETYYCWALKHFHSKIKLKEIKQD
jgi:hypothetical protein